MEIGDVGTGQLSPVRQRSPRRTATPDVTVILAVYNTMPYLTRCLDSLAKQTIGRDRIEVIAVDDGSTDGSAEELDRFARRYPKTFTVVHQANSGGPAAPSNRALERATGRYVFFVGADDYLGREALERLVRAADRHGSDIVLGKLVGVNGRYVNPAVYARSATDIGLFDSPLPWALSNTKLFRRELIEQHGLRFDEELPVASDQPFTFEACLQAARISVLADYTFYYAVRRTDASNITFGNSHERHLAAAEVIMHFVAGRIAPGKDRDAVLVRHFTWEVGKLVMDDFLTLDRDVQERLHAGIRALADQYLTDDIRHRLDIKKRVRLSLAQRGELDDLLAAIRCDVEDGDVPVVVTADRCYARYPGFQDARLDLPNSWFDVSESVAKQQAAFDAVSVVWAPDGDGAPALAVQARGTDSAPVPLAAPQVRLAAGDSAGVAVVPGRSDDGIRIEARLPLGHLVAESPTAKTIVPIMVEVEAFGGAYRAPLQAPKAPRPGGWSAGSGPTCTFSVL
ncbi:hypothetical protein Prum_036620 [Phytohabitans rumicis]|uniref:Uncharacterized protein n=1 Tax=Phytohabitans rumicis TaxID=1076125 RepID=A0A6V8L3A1_9ACTN|nr:hypothetical protein Prum_036620 [Phytohabitans rumicis]